MKSVSNTVGVAGLALALLAAPALAAKQAVVLVGDDDYPPYSYKDAGGTPKGIYADLLRKVGAAMPNFTIELRTAPWKRALVQVEQGELIGMYPPYKKPEARPWMGYSTPLLNETVVLVCTAKIAQSHKDKPWPTGYAGLRFGNNAGFQTPGKPFFDMAAAGKLALEEAKTTEQNLRKLAEGRIDCYPNDRRAIDSEVKRLQLDLNGAAETAVIGKESGYVGYTSKAGAFAYQAAFMKEFDETVLKLRAAGQLPPLD
ncbi:substrate-binding periplasmic protein [Chitinimonas koreensis]|uniref:substrate-binding periplasmic protein n=1 Tax=Chitinimonas koreensis TaxID=356302 RepID=UPI00040BC966|nr:transporter substrate-binding domain-containing protein [Chitinimonas koreensis]QNM97921.1 transporter substrate-binding domain-containing protein [Chitinimonas koreensis]